MPAKDLSGFGTTRRVPAAVIFLAVALSLGISLALAPAALATDLISVDIYADFSLPNGDPVPSSYVGSLTANDVLFGTNSGWNWHPFLLDKYCASINGYFYVSQPGTYNFTGAEVDYGARYIDGIYMGGAGWNSWNRVEGFGFQASLTAGVHSFTWHYWQNPAATYNGCDFYLPEGVVWCAASGPVNPTAYAGPQQTVYVGSTVQLNGTGTDPYSQPLTYAWSFTAKPDGSTAALSDPTVPNPTFTADKEGSYGLRLIVTDSLGLASQPSNVIINTVNHGLLTVSIYSDFSLPMGDPVLYSYVGPVTANDVLFGTNSGWNWHPYQLNRYGADIQGYIYVAQPNTYAFSAAMVDYGAVFIDGINMGGGGWNQWDRVETWGFSTFLSAGVHSFRWTYGQNPADTYNGCDFYLPPGVVWSTATGPATPTANAGNPQTVHVGSTAQLSGSGSDPGSLPLTYAWSFISRPAGSAATLSDPALFNPTFMADKEGNYELQLVVTNTLGLASQPANVTISTSNSAPTADAGSPQTVLQGTPATLDGSKSSDPDGDPITFAWRLESKPEGSNAALSDATSPTPSFIADVSGNYVVQLVVTDSWGAASQPAFVTIGTGPTAVRLKSFTATGAATYVQLNWQTGSEINNAAFRLWRRDGTQGDYAPNRSLIPAKGSPSRGAKYSYKDTAVVKGHTYYYKLEDLARDGTSTFHGPVSAIVAANSGSGSGKKRKAK